MTLHRTILRRATRLLDNPLVSRTLRMIIRSRSTLALMQRLKWKVKLALGKRLVPEEALTLKYREALLWLIQQEGKEALGDYLEFGVFNGTSLSCMHRTVRELQIPRMRLFGFDSFEGLPANAANCDGGFWHPGSFCIDYDYSHRWLTRRGVDWTRVFLIKGWFCDTLNPSLLAKHRISKVSVAMVDCDTYLSSKEALSFCAPLIQDHAVILLDDWASEGLAARNMGEKRAMDEFLAENPGFVVEDFGNYHGNSKVFKLLRTGMKETARAIVDKGKTAAVAGGLMVYELCEAGQGFVFLLR